MKIVMKVSVALGLSVICFLQAALAALPGGGIELVQSVPVETTLAVPGIRQTQQVWLDMIGAAHKSIDIEEFYIFNKPGESLDPVLAAIRAAAGRGVKVRLLVDLKFYKNYPTEPDALGKVPNIQMKTIDVSPGVQHAKYFIVDGADAYVGSANTDWLALSHIHEVGLHISDARIGADLTSVFERDWGAGSPPANLAPGHRGRHGRGGEQFQVVASPASLNPAKIPPTLGAILGLLASARTSIKVQVYEYSTKVYQSTQTWTDLDKALRAAAARGVHVQLLVDAKALTTGGPDLKALAALPNIEVRSVVIPQWSGGPLQYARLIHSKYFVVDGVSGWVGSENWSGGYFTSSRNVGLVFQAPSVAGKLEQIFNQVWSSSYATGL